MTAGEGPGEGRVVFIAITREAGAPMCALEAATAIPGHGLAGDRYAAGSGFYSARPLPGGARELTLIEAEVLDWLRDEHAIELPLEQSRRNVTTRGVRLNQLVGRRFRVGEVLCEGVRLCEPCVRLEDLTGKPVLRPLVDRGGLRANILTAGTIRLGDAVRPEQ